MADQSSILVLCPNLTCRKMLSVPKMARGKTVRCRYCRASIRVPSEGAPKQKQAASGQ